MAKGNGQRLKALYILKILQENSDEKHLLKTQQIIDRLEGYGNENPNARSQGIKQLMAGGGIVLIGMQLIPQLAGLF